MSATKSFILPDLYNNTNCNKINNYCHVTENQPFRNLLYEEPFDQNFGKYFHYTGKMENRIVWICS